MLVTSKAFVICGRTEIPRLFIAITYGDAAAVPEPADEPERMSKSVLSLDGMTIPTQSALPMKKNAKRAYVVLNAVFKYRRGSFVSPATIEIYSGPTTVNDALHTAPRNPSNRPSEPVVMCSANEPGSFQYRNP